MRAVLRPLLILTVLGTVCFTGCAARLRGDPSTEHPAMTVATMERIIRELARDVRSRGNVMEFVFDDVPMTCIYDTGHDRMRVVAGVTETSKVSQEQRAIILEADFHTALDARYATSKGILYAAFIHPLSPLQDKELRSGLSQVASLVKTFGTTYSSGELAFGAGSDEEHGPDA